MVGHPLNALDREIKRLVVREQLEKDQNKIVEEDGINSKEVNFNIIFLYIPSFLCKQKNNEKIKFPC